VKARLDCAERHVRLDGDALQWHVLEEAQRDDLTLTGWQTVDRLAQTGCLFHIHHVLEWVGRTIADMLRCGLDGGRDPPPGAGRAGNRDPSRDPSHPRSESAIAAVSGKGAIGPDKRILRSVLRLIRIPKHAQAHANHCARFALDQQPVYVPVASQHGVDECSIVHNS